MSLAEMGALPTVQAIHARLNEQEKSKEDKRGQFIFSASVVTFTKHSREPGSLSEAALQYLSCSGFQPRVQLRSHVWRLPRGMASKAV